MATGLEDSVLNLPLSSELKEVIEEAAASLGQSASDFAISTLMQRARAVLHQRDVTILSKQDWDRFISLIDDPDAAPNAALLAAAERSRKYRG